jgi:hypothetical protein
VVGAAVTVKKVDVSAAGGLVAICYRGRERQAIPILEQIQQPALRPSRRAKAPQTTSGEA